MNEVTEGMEIFVRVVEAGSVSAAARELGEPRESVSRQLSRLEARLGVRLLHRGPRRLVPTAAGETLYRRVRPLIAAARDAAEEVRQHDDVPRGLIRVSIPPGEGASRMGAVAASFLARWPEVRIELVTSTRHVDLVAEGFDIALRAGTVRDGNLIARKLLRMETLALASPGYLGRRGIPQSPEELGEHECILGMGGGALPQLRWPLRDGGEVQVRGRLVTDDIRAAHSACQAGLGIALLPHLLEVDRLVAEGQLVPVLRDRVGTEGTVSLVMVERERVPVRVRAFFDHVVGTLPPFNGPVGAVTGSA